MTLKSLNQIKVLLIIVFIFIGCSSNIIRGMHHVDINNAKYSLCYISLNCENSINDLNIYKEIATLVSTELIKNKINSIISEKNDTIDNEFINANKLKAISLIIIDVIKIDKATFFHPIVDNFIKISFYDTSTKKLYYIIEINESCFGIKYIGAPIGECVYKKISDAISNYSCLYPRGML
ncbi:MAG: hypothetical protein EOM37_14175 [Proteobacteria bacterium]|nr:hypothetical protein [Pseudomonadota bacterium]